MKLEEIKSCLEKISPWPWHENNPQQTYWLRNPEDVSFIHKSPELVAQLLRMVEVSNAALKQAKIDFIYLCAPKENLVSPVEAGLKIEEALAEMKRLEDE